MSINISDVVQYYIIFIVVWIPIYWISKLNLLMIFYTFYKKIKYIYKSLLNPHN